VKAAYINTKPSFLLSRKKIYVGSTLTMASHTKNRLL